MTIILKTKTFFSNSSKILSDRTIILLLFFPSFSLYLSFSLSLFLFLNLSCSPTPLVFPPQTLIPLWFCVLQSQALAVQCCCLLDQKLILSDFPIFLQQFYKTVYRSNHKIKPNKLPCFKLSNAAAKLTTLYGATTLRIMAYFITALKKMTLS